MTGSRFQILDKTSKQTMGLAEYIWLDAEGQVRSKSRVIVSSKDKRGEPVPDLPLWSFDGSSTGQAEGHASDLILSPCHYVTDPFRGGDNFLVLCEVRQPTPQGSDLPHPSNARADLRAVLDAGGGDVHSWWGFEQEYFLVRPYKNRRNKRGEGPLMAGWPRKRDPAPQGPYYCGVGGGKVAGRAVAEDHMRACLQAGLSFVGVNAEVALGQWEFQIGPRSFDSLDNPTSEDLDPSRLALHYTDHLILARWILCRIAEDHGFGVDPRPKPLTGDWNGSGMHTNFSTRDMRDPYRGRSAIAACLEALGANHAAHIQVYGEGNERRLTGEHETAPIGEFRVGKSDRGASVRIPLQVASQGHGYIEDRRPAANADPYKVAARILRTVCGLSDVTPPSLEDRAQTGGALRILDGGRPDGDAA